MRSRRVASASVSMPSATVGTPRLRDRPMMASTTLALCGRSRSVCTNERSILILSKSSSAR